MPRRPSQGGAPSATDDALALLERAARLVQESADVPLKARGLTRVHHRLLSTLAQHGELRVGALVEALGVSKQAVHPPLTHLLEEGLVRARPSPESGRVKLLSLTAAGAKLEAQLSAPLRRRLERALRGAGRGAEATWREVMVRLLG
jgi:DNA-binding MarR family transcriptional regulator